MLGIASLSALGPFGAAVEITVILYPSVISCIITVCDTDFPSNNDYIFTFASSCFLLYASFAAFFSSSSFNKS